MDRRDSIRRLLSPKTAAFIGGNGAVAAIKQSRIVGFEGEYLTVNPQRDDMAGVPCHKSVKDLPAVPDAAFVAAPPAASIDVIRELAQAGAGGAVCYASGFGELGGDGKKLQQELIDAAGDMPVIGPNCHGFINYLDGIALWPDEHGGHRVDSGIAMITQSGNFGINLSMQRRGIDFAYIITIGNKTCLSLHEYIDYLVTDKRVTAIGLHIEGIDHVHDFSIAAINALKAGIPIVAIKTGRSAKGASINMSHTASLAGEDRLYEALFDRLGIARCNTVVQFLETLKLVSTVGALPSNTIGSMSCSGGEASLIADGADAVGLDMPALSAESAEHLSDILGPKVPLSNPLDYHTYAWGNREQLTDCFTTMLTNQFGCTMLVLDYPTPEHSDISSWEVAESALADSVKATGQKAVIVSTLTETMRPEAADRIRAAGITPMQGIEECLFAIRAAAKIGLAQRSVASIQPVMRFGNPAGDAGLLDEWESKTRLKSAGVPVPEGRVCTAEETVDAAEAIGYPVVLKAVSAELAHKTEAGGVKLNLCSASEVQAETGKMAANFDRFLVEKMVGPVVAELIVGVSRDPSFGLTLLIGSGGTLVELVRDSVSLLLPASKSEIDLAIRKLKVAALIDGWRGQDGGDFEAVANAIAAIADFAMANGNSLVEMDVNPLIVLKDGVVAADAVIRFTD
jgi:acetyl-CoA synthetase